MNSTLSKASQVQSKAFTVVLRSFLNEEMSSFDHLSQEVSSGKPHSYLPPSFTSKDTDWSRYIATA